MKHYDALICSGNRELLDIVIAASSILPVTGLLDRNASVVLYFDEGTYSEEFEQNLRTWLPENTTDITFELGKVEEQNWNAEFEKSLEPVRVSDRLILTQSWNTVPSSPDELVIVIDPKMSFGTGHHESTRLIARLMERLDFTGKRVLDIGTGTGVLAILAARLGAAHIVAFDNNEWAVENSRENIETNGVADSIQLFQGELSDLDQTDFDIILANMHRNVIIELLPEMITAFGAAAAPRLLTSGILLADYQSLLEKTSEAGLQALADERENEWIATTFAPNA